MDLSMPVPRVLFVIKYYCLIDLGGLTPLPSAGSLLVATTGATSRHPLE